MKGLRAGECNGSDECRGHRLSQCVDSPGLKNKITRRNSQGLKRRDSGGQDMGGGSPNPTTRYLEEANEEPRGAWTIRGIWV